MPDSAQSSHPGTGQLAAFALGKLTGEELDAIQAHLSGCSACRKSLESLPKSAAGGESVSEIETLATVGLAPPASPTRDSIAQVADSPALGATAAYQPVSDVPADLANHPRYEILQLLGQGGMGAVYKARHTVMNRLVALKIMNARLVGNTNSVERFHREVQAA